MKRKIFLLLTTVLTVSLITGCTQKMEENKEEKVVAITVKTKSIEPETIEQYVNISSKAESENEISVIPKVSGTVKKVYAGLGDTVKAGDVLFEIDDTDLALQVSQSNASLSSAQAGLESSQANYEKNIGGSLETQLQQLQSTVDSYEIQYTDLLNELERTKELYAIGGASKISMDDLQSSVDKMKLQLETAQNELDTNKNKIAQETEKSSRASVSQSQASVAQAQVSLEGAVNSLNDAKVRAEIDGVISNCNVTEGSTVSTQSTAMTIVTTERIKIAFNVSEDVINRISVGTKVYVTISSVSEQAFETVLSNVSPASDSQTKLYKVEAYLDNVDGSIKSGMFASAKLVLDKKENTVSVPLNTVIEKNEEKYVYIVDDNNIAHKTIVETGLKNDEDVEILNGVELGDNVVVTGQDFLSDGSTVNIAES